jgi:hypothetical protein
MWSTLSFAGVLWMVFINLLSWNIKHTVIWPILLFVGWALLVVIGLCL